MIETYRQYPDGRGNVVRSILLERDRSGSGPETICQIDFDMNGAADVHFDDDARWLDKADIEQVLRLMSSPFDESKVTERD